jgi:hypothetical protein
VEGVEVPWKVVEGYWICFFPPTFDSGVRWVCVDDVLAWSSIDMVPGFLFTG